MKPEPGRAMQYWTHHPRSFSLETPDLQIDPTKGEYWNSEEFCYREVAPKLWERIGTNQFLWCFTHRGGYVRAPGGTVYIEWEIKAPPCRVLAYINALVWWKLVKSEPTDWAGLILEEEPTEGNSSIHALISVPLAQNGVICHGPVPCLPPVKDRAPPNPQLASEYDFDPN